MFEEYWNESAEHHRHDAPSLPFTHVMRSHRYAQCMTVRELLESLQHLPRDVQVLAFEAGCDDYCEREVDELELQGGRVYLHLGARRDEPPQR
jgi:hypothetical protein